MDKLAEITKKAVLHYKQWVEPEAEKRMSELYRVSAQQRLQRTVRKGFFVTFWLLLKKIVFRKKRKLKTKEIIIVVC